MNNNGKTEGSIQNALMRDLDGVYLLNVYTQTVSRLCGENVSASNFDTFLMRFEKENTETLPGALLPEAESILAQLEENDIIRMDCRFIQSGGKKDDVCLVFSKADDPDEVVISWRKIKKDTKRETVDFFKNEKLKEYEKDRLESLMKSKKDEEELKKRFEIVEALSRDYLHIYLLSLSGQEAMLTPIGGKAMKKGSDLPEDTYPYDKLIKKYVNDRVYPGDALRMSREMDVNLIKNKLASDREYSDTFRVLSGAEIHHYQFRFIALENFRENPRAVLAFKNVDSLINDARERKNLVELSELDGLTKILNRGCGEMRTREAVKNGRSGMLCLFDVDNFKIYNDNYGHKAGDKVLKSVADRLKKSFRDVDVVFRLGGDEFAVYAFGIEDEDTGRAIINRLYKLIDEIKIKEVGERAVTLSGGAVIVNEINNISFEDLYKRADSGVYKSKNQKGNAINFYN